MLRQFQIKYKIPGVYVPYLYKQKTVKIEVPTDQLGFWQFNTLESKLQSMVPGYMLSFRILDM